MSVSPVSGVTGTSTLQQPTAAQIATASAPATSAAAQSAPTVDAAQAWEDAMRAAMGDESASPTATAPTATAPATTAPVTTSPTGTANTTTALTPQALAALVSGSSTASADPLITSLSAPSAATTQAPSADGSFV
jgi:hypothetical protein